MKLYFDVICKALPLLLEENPDRPHGYVLGTPGSGKSELLKILVHTFVTNPSYGAVVVLDPGSDFVGEIARWKELQTGNRLIYVRPTLARGLCPTINPFEISGVGADDYSEEALDIKRVVAQELVEAIGRIVTEEVTGSVLTGPMRTILRNCVLVLLDKPGATLFDLLHFMREETSNELLAFAQSLSHHPNIAEYFALGRFTGGGGNKITKEAIERRLDGLLGVGPFAELTCGKSTIDLEEAINSRKVILFDLGKGAIGADEGRAFGKLLIGMLVGIAYRRERIPISKRVPCSLIVDECHNFVSESMEDILRETRKYRLMLTLSQQISGQKMSPSLRDTVMQTTNMQFVGGTPRSGSTRNADLVGTTAEEIRKLDIGEFFVRPSRHGSLMKFKTRTDLLGNKNGVTSLTWRRTVKDQLRRYYGTTAAPVVSETTDVDDADTDAGEWS